MQIQISLSPRAIVKYLVVGVIFFGLVSTGIQICKYVFDYRADWMTLFNLDRELNFPTWYSTLMLGFCALLLKIIASDKKQQQERYAADWQLLSWIFLCLAVDEILSVHELLIIPEVSEALKLPWFLHSMWVIPGTIFVFWFVRRYWKFSLKLPPKSQQHFFTAAGTYVGGALIMEMVGSYLAEAEGQQNLAYALVATAEEIMEMVGVIIFIYGLLYYLSKSTAKINLQIKILEVTKDENFY